MAVLIEDVSASFRMHVSDSLNIDDADEFFWSILNDALKEAGIEIETYDIPYTNLEK